MLATALLATEEKTRMVPALFATETHVIRFDKNGNTLIGASGRCALLIVNPAGEIIDEIKVKSTKPHKRSLTMARQIENGNFLVAEESLSLIREYNPAGKAIWEMKTPFRPFSVVRTENGNTFASGKDGIIEVNPEKEIVWQSSLPRKEAGAGHSIFLLDEKPPFRR